MDDTFILPEGVKEQLKSFQNIGLQITSYHELVFKEVERAIMAAKDNDWKSASRIYSKVLGHVPPDDKVIIGSLLHDMAVFSEKAGNIKDSINKVEESVKSFSEANIPIGQVHALDTMIGIYTRSGKDELADDAKKSKDTLIKKNNLFPVRFDKARRDNIESAALTAEKFGLADDNMLGIPLIMGMKYVDAIPTKTFTSIGTDKTTVSILLDKNAAENVKKFNQELEDNEDVSHLAGFGRGPVHMVAYLPHLYYYVLPMIIGDCLVGLGNLNEAEEEYLSVLTYPYINKKYEIVKLWTRLAQVYIDMGDDRYKKAKDDISSYNEAKTVYENIVLSNGKLNDNSPLYKDAKFGALRSRAEAFLSTDDPLSVNDNPAFLSKILTGLKQIDAQLNYSGFSSDYVPPFSFDAKKQQEGAVAALVDFTVERPIIDDLAAIEAWDRWPDIVEERKEDFDLQKPFKERKTWT